MTRALGPQGRHGAAGGGEEEMLPAEGIGLSRKDPGVVTSQAKGTSCAEPQRGRGAAGLHSISSPAIGEHTLLSSTKSGRGLCHKASLRRFKNLSPAFSDLNTLK